MIRAWISVGSNIEPEKQVRQAVCALRQTFGPLVLSPVYRTPAEGFVGDDFLNLIVGIDTDWPQDDVRRALRRIEDAQGRLRNAEKFSSRTLDLDLLTWGQTVDVDRAIPRDEILRYGFVLKPLADVAPNEPHPVLGVCYARLWADFPGDKTALRPVVLPGLTVESCAHHPQQ